MMKCLLEPGTQKYDWPQRIALTLGHERRAAERCAERTRPRNLTKKVRSWRVRSKRFDDVAMAQLAAKKDLSVSS
jgi:hypothetical protein